MTDSTEEESSAERMARLRAGFAPRAAEMVAGLGGPAVLFEERLPAQGHWFIDDDVLAVVGGPDETQAGIDLLLAYGLAWAGDRDLWVVLPMGLHRPTMYRWPWIDPHVRLWNYFGETVDERVVPARVEVQGGLKDPLTKDIHGLGDREEWVAGVVGWADGHGDLVDASRGSYRSWHCEGRQVLRLERTHAGVRVSAGVAYSKPTPDQVAADIVELDGPATSEQYAVIRAAVEVAVARRKDGTDDTHLEHRFQARLQPSDLGLVEWDRERPAVRSGGALGFIDFLGVDPGGVVHVVETKIGPDPMLALQGLDYWVWATAHLETLSERFQTAVSKVVLDFVVAPKPGSEKALSPYTAPVAAALDGGVPWRFWTVPPGWNEADNLALTRHSSRTVPAQ